jgi:hypothetical protein
MTPVSFNPHGVSLRSLTWQPSFMPFRVFMPLRVLLGSAENLQFEEQIFYRHSLRCFGFRCPQLQTKRQWEKI